MVLKLDQQFRKADACQELLTALMPAKAGNQDRRGNRYSCSWGQREALQHLVDETRARLGQIDILVCNAAVNPFYGSMQEHQTMPWTKF